MLAGVLPPAPYRYDRESAALGVGAVDVGDLELTPTGRLEARDDLEHIRRVAVEPDNGIVRRRGVVAEIDDARLLGEVDDCARAVVDDDAEVLGVGDVLDEQEGRVAPFVAPVTVVPIPSPPSPLPQAAISVAWEYSKMLSPRTTTSRSPPAKSFAMPTTSAIPPGRVCTL